MTEVQNLTPLGQLLRDPDSAPPREQLQAVVAVLLGRPDVRSSVTLGVDPWHGLPQQDELLQLLAIRKVLRWLAGESGDDLQQHVVNLLRGELAGLLKLLDEQCQKAGGVVRDGGDAVASFRCQRVEDSAAGVEPVILVRQLAKDLFSVGHRSFSSKFATAADQLSARLVASINQASERHLRQVNSSLEQRIAAIKAAEAAAGSQRALTLWRRSLQLVRAAVRSVVRRQAA